jgi:hypothetical protein
MIGPKVKLFSAVIFACSLVLLLLGLTYLVFPERTGKMPPPLPEPSTFAQISIAIYWIGITAVITLSVVGLFFLLKSLRRHLPVNRIKSE